MNKYDDLYNEVLININKYNSHGYDILMDDIINQEKIDFFITTFSKNIINEAFTEGTVNVVYYDKAVKNGYQDKFEFDSAVNKFYTTVTYYDTEFIISQIESNILANLAVGQKVECLKEYVNYLNKSKNKQVAYFEFENFEHVKSLTGKVKNYSYNVLGSVVRSIRQSLRNHNNLTKINSIYCAINKSEEKRLQIYNKIVSDEINHLKNKCIDNVSNFNNILIYYW